MVASPNESEIIYLHWELILISSQRKCFGTKQLSLVGKCREMLRAPSKVAWFPEYFLFDKKLSSIIMKMIYLKMLQLFASKEHPRAEENIWRVALNHGEQQVIQLESHCSEVDSSRADLPRVPWLQHESRNRNNHRFVGFVISLELCAFSKESYCCPEDSCSNCRNHYQRKKSSHLRQRDLMITERGLNGQQWKIIQFV